MQAGNIYPPAVFVNLIMEDFGQKIGGASVGDKGFDRRRNYAIIGAVFI